MDAGTRGAGGDLGWDRGLKATGNWAGIVSRWMATWVIGGATSLQTSPLRGERLPELSALRALLPSQFAGLPGVDHLAIDSRVLAAAVAM